MKNTILILISLICFYSFTFSQEVSVSKEIPESENTFIGTWGSKVFSYRVLELFIVDTASVIPTREVVKIGPEVDKADRMGSVRYFIHDHFLYEVYFVIPKYDTDHLKGYNVLVKRDLETMKIVTQKRLEHLHSQMKFVKCFDGGFYFCLGDSYSIFTGDYNVFFESPAREVTPKIVYSFNYDLDELWSMKLDPYMSYSRLMNDISFDNEYLLIPTFSLAAGDGKILNLVVADLKGKIADIKLNFDMENKYQFNGAKAKYDDVAQRFRAVILISMQDKKARTIESGYIYLNWDEKGKLLGSFKHLFKAEELFNSYQGEPNLKETDFSYRFTAYERIQTDILYFDILENGDAICAVNNVCRDSDIKSLRNSKFIWRISKDGNLEWSQFIPYDEDLLYFNSFCLMRDGTLHIYTREKAKTFNTGSDTKRESSVLLADRMIDIHTGNLISHKSILNQPIGNYTPEWLVSSFTENEYIVRYRKSAKNVEKLVFMHF